MKKVGAHSPTKIPKRSAWAWLGSVVPPVMNQMAMEPTIEAKPKKKQIDPRSLSWLGCIAVNFRLIGEIAMRNRFYFTPVPEKRAVPGVPSAPDNREWREGEGCD